MKFLFNTLKYFFSTLLLLIFFYSCNDDVKINKSDILKYDWLKPFIIDTLTDLSGTHNLDLGIIDFSTDSKKYKIDDYLLHTDSIAKKGNWIFFKIDNNTREYQKTISQSGFLHENYKIIISINKKENRIYYKISRTDISEYSVN